MTYPTELRAERFLLRPFRLEDVDDVFAYASYPEWGRYLPTPQPYTRRDAEEFVARRVLDAWDTHPTFAVVYQSKVVGGIELGVDASKEIAELGFSIAREHWVKGLVPEAARAVID
jgi:RimJ/RimL family protein N-acetyltransferase